MIKFRLNSIARRALTARIVLLCLIFNIFVPTLAKPETGKKYFRPLEIIASKPSNIDKSYFMVKEDDVAITVSRSIKPKKTIQTAYIGPETVAVEEMIISPDDCAIESPCLISPDNVACEPEADKPDLIGPDDVAVAAPKAFKLDPGAGLEADKPDLIGPDDVACESKDIKRMEKVTTPPAQIIEYARNFWAEADNQIDKRNIQISGTKTFSMKKADVKGDIGHFSTDNYDSIPGFHLDQSLHLEIDGNITENSTVHAILDDKDDEDRRFTVNIDGPVWKFVMGDFPLMLEGTELILFQKEVRGVMAQGSFHDRFKSIFLFSQSKGLARREQFRGAGQQQEFRLQGSPVVQNSERVSIDGVQLTRGSDYFVDYEDGVIKLLPHILPVELTSWVIVEYEVSDTNMAFTRNLFGTRHTWNKSEDRELSVTWMREVDSSTPKNGEVASSTATPMQHDIVGADINWQITPAHSIAAETSVSFLDPNKNSDQAVEDKSITGHASRLKLHAQTQKYGGDLTFRRIDKDFKVIGREGGVTELGERGLVNDILTGQARLEYHFTDKIRSFADAEKSQTNLSDDPALQSIDYMNQNAGFVYENKDSMRLEVRGGQQHDREKGPMTRSDVIRDTSTAVWDKKFGNLNTQTKVQNTAYNDSINTASDSSVLEMGLTMGAQAHKSFAWNAGISRIAVEDEMVKNDLRSEIRNYNLDLNFEPSRSFSARGIFQWRKENDYLANTKLSTEIADSQLRYEPNRDIRTQLKYKIENTSKVLRDPTLDPEKYILPPSLPHSEYDEEEILTTFENPVQKTTANFLTDYRINRYLQAYFDWRRREIIDQSNNKMVSSNDRKTYELRYTPMEKMLVTTEYELGTNKNINPKTELNDFLKTIQVRHEFYEGCFLDATYEERDEDDKYSDTYDKFTKSKILGFQRKFNAWATMELALQHNDIKELEPSTELEKRLAFILSPFSRSQRYKFFINHKNITAKESGTQYEGGLNFSQFIGTDTMIDGEVKKVYSSPGINGDGYDAMVFNAEMVITF